MSHETVGTLLAVIANNINEALRTLHFADKRSWARDEYEQLRLLEDTLDTAKQDFQELPALINGSIYYENDRNEDSLEDLRHLVARFEAHTRLFKDWLRTGGPIDATWATQTILLRRELHKAQCRAVRRIHATQQQTRSRCLGAQQVHRIQQQALESSSAGADQTQRRLEEAAACNRTGKFERLGETDVAFVCDFCDGYIVWSDLREMPATRNHDEHSTTNPSITIQNHDAGEMPEPVSTTNLAPSQTWPSETVPFSPGLPPDTISSPRSKSQTLPPDSYVAAQQQWLATGFSKSSNTQKPIVFAPLAVANHVAPGLGDWQAGLLCPFCDEYYYVEQGDPDVDQIKFVQNENGFEDLEALREHLEWYHAPVVSNNPSCSVM